MATARPPGARSDWDDHERALIRAEMVRELRSGGILVMGRRAVETDSTLDDAQTD